MPLDNTNFLLSFAVLQNKGIERQKLFAASAVAALTPGPLGLMVALVIARQQTDTDTRPSQDALAKVPDVESKSQAEAENILKERGLSTVILSRHIQPTPGEDDPPEGSVVDQDPEGGTWVAVGSNITLTVSSGPPPPPEDGGIDHEELQEEVKAVRGEVATAKTEIIAAIKAKDYNPKPAGSIEKK